MLTSFVIPTFDNYDQLGQCVQSIYDNAGGHEFEIIIMDNGSKPLGYVDPTNRGLRAASGDLLIALNDDVLLPSGVLGTLLDEARKGTWVFSPDHPADQGKALGWFLCFSRDGYERTGGFDPQFKLWCADVDLFKRCENYGKPVRRVAGPHIQHEYSATTSHPDWQEEIIAWQRQDIYAYQRKWGTDPNVDKLR